MRLALLALNSLDELDDSLYARFVATRTIQEDPETAAAHMRKLWNDTFRAQLHLLARCEQLAAQRPQPESTPPPPDPPDLDFGDLEAPLSFADEDLALAIEASDIGDLVANLGPERPQSEPARWAAAVDKIADIHFALAGQFHDATERLETALAAGHTNQVLGLLDEITSLSNEGIHAIVMAIYDAFVADADPGSVVPAYQTTLRRALMVRRGVAALHAEISPLNVILQQTTQKDRWGDIVSIIGAALTNFVHSKTCRAMRAADRWELSQFQHRFQTETIGELRTTSEGLVKYLESLNVVNQREVLVQHDRQAASEIRDGIATARGLTDLSPRTAYEMVVKACLRAQDLRGRSSLVDPLLEELRAAAMSSSPADNLPLLARLEQVVDSAGL